jgi:serine carboxypeptidase-like clade 2
LGNPETSDAEDWRGLVDYAWSHAVISDETHRIISENCDFNGNDTWSNNDCSQAVDEVLKQYKEIDIYSLYTSTCIGNSADSEGRSLQVMMNRTTNMVSNFTIQITSSSYFKFFLDLKNQATFSFLFRYISQ